MRKGESRRAVQRVRVHLQTNGFPIENTELEQKIRGFVDAQPQLPYEGHAGELENVLSALEKDTLPAIGGEDGRRTIELITAVYKSGATNQTVTLPIQKEDTFYTVEGMMLASAPLL